MLETFFATPRTLERLRAGPAGPYLDGFARRLKDEGYGRSTAGRYLRAAAHLGRCGGARGGPAGGRGPPAPAGVKTSPAAPSEPEEGRSQGTGLGPFWRPPIRGV